MKLFNGAMVELRCGGKVGPFIQCHPSGSWKIKTENDTVFSGCSWFLSGMYLHDSIKHPFDIVKVLNPEAAPRRSLADVIQAGELKEGMKFESDIYPDIEGISYPLYSIKQTGKIYNIDGKLFLHVATDASHIILQNIDDVRTGLWKEVEE